MAWARSQCRGFGLRSIEMHIGSFPPPPPPPPPKKRAPEKPADSPPLVALGVLSTIQSFGCQFFMGRTRCRTVPSQARWRRDRLRTEHSQSTANATILLRFLIAGGRVPDAGQNASIPPLEPYMRAASASDFAAAEAEAQRHGDLLFLPLHEDQLGGCSRKYLAWLRLAVDLHPHASFVALADDDVYIQFAHFSADMAHVHRYHRTSSDELIYWGFLFWRPYYNRITKAVAEGLDYETHDASVSKRRYRIERCAWEQRYRASSANANASVRPSSSLLRRWHSPPLVVPHGDPH